MSFMAPPEAQGAKAFFYTQKPYAIPGEVKRGGLGDLWVLWYLSLGVSFIGVKVSSPGSWRVLWRHSDYF